MKVETVTLSALARIARVRGVGGGESHAGKIVDMVMQQGYEVSAMRVLQFDEHQAREFLEVYDGVVPEYREKVGETKVISSGTPGVTIRMGDDCDPDASADKGFEAAPPFASKCMVEVAWGDDVVDVDVVRIESRNTECLSLREVQVNGCGALRNLAAKGTATCERITKAGGVEAIVAALNVHRGDVQVQVHA